MLTQRNRTPVLVCTALALVSLALATNGCGKSSSGTLASIQYGQYTAMNRYFDPLLDLISSTFESTAEAATSSIHLCVHRVRFKSAGESDSSDLSSDEDSEDVSGDDQVGIQGWVAVSSTGSFGTVTVPRPKEAQRMEVDIDNHCSGHPAAELTNSNGYFSTNSSFTMTFVSPSAVDLTRDNTVNLGWQSINNALNTLASGATDAQIVAAFQTQGTM